MQRGIWIAGVIALGLVILFIARTTDDRKHETTLPPAPPVPVLEPEPQPEVEVERIQCPACQGSGYVIEPDKRDNMGLVCRLCLGKGGKELRIPPGNVKCSHCQGLGRTETRGKGYTICPLCRGQGYVKAPFQPSP